MEGQSDKGDNLPSATYYYVIELNKGVTKNRLDLSNQRKIVN
jgi:hypothetical protein